MRCRLEQLEQVTGEPDQDAIGNETLHISEGKGGTGSLVGGALGIGAETVESIQDGEGGGEAGGRILEPQEVTLKNIYDLINELGETNNQIREHLSWRESHEDSGTANLPETNDADEEEQGSDDENDLSVFVVLGDR